MLQQKLIARGYSCGSSGADGDYGDGTYNAVCKFQSDHGLEVDGISGPITLSAINGSAGCTVLRKGNKGALVKELQEKLIAKGYSCGSSGADGDFGQGTYNAVVSFQRDHGLDADGIVGPSTWSALYNSVSKGSAVSGGKGVARFLEVARAEIGTREQYDNITKYGAWFNNNGQYWCAQFVSWCAAQAGILGTIVPCYENCKLGANWYRAKGRYRTRLSGYVPFPGDIIFFTNSNNFYYHTGIVEFVKDGVVHTIEGNSNDCVRRVEYSIIDSKINGYGVNGGIISPINNANDKLEAKQTLYNTLAKYRDEHLSAVQKAKSDRTFDQAFNGVWNNINRIVEVSKELNIPKEIMEAVIFREQMCIGIEDALADQLVKSGDRDDSSTGLGQIFAKTAIKASNEVFGTTYKIDNINDVKNMWWTLQSDYTNILYVAAVLLYESRNLKIQLTNANRENIQKVISKYNGTGDSAVTYGQQTILYYDAYKKYSDTV